MSATAKRYIERHAPDINLKGCEHCEGTGKVPRQYDTGRDMARYRERSGVGLRQLARLLELSPSYLCHLERGERAWSMALVRRYLDAVERAR